MFIITSDLSFYDTKTTALYTIRVDTDGTPVLECSLVHPAICKGEYVTGFIKSVISNPERQFILEAMDEAVEGQVELSHTCVDCNGYFENVLTGVDCGIFMCEDCNKKAIEIENARLNK